MGIAIHTLLTVQGIQSVQAFHHWATFTRYEEILYGRTKLCFRGGHTMAWI